MMMFNVASDATPLGWKMTQVLLLALITVPTLAIPAATQKRMPLTTQKTISLSGQYATLRSTFRRDECFQRHAFRVSQSGVAWQRAERKFPGAGLDEVVPFETVLKDGFMHMACIKDYMFFHGDKFGDNRYDYEIQDTSNVSIVHYSAIVAKEDRQAMTPQVCFDFCRTVPDMGFFGIFNGRECYCAPHIDQMASDDSVCDAVCEGDAKLMGCGGESKSDVFEMHMCASTAKDLKAAINVSKTLSGELATAVENLTLISETGIKAVSEFQKKMGQVGDLSAADLFQKAKVRAGVLTKLMQEANESVKALNDLEKKAESMERDDFTSFASVKEAEELMDEIKKVSKQGGQIAERIKKQLSVRIRVKTEKSGDDYLTNYTLKYVPAMNFVDRAYLTDQSTCTGDLVTDPLFGLFLDECAYACSLHSLDCVGYSHFETGGICFLFSKLTELTHYSDCLGRKQAEKDADRPSSFLQRLSESDANFQKVMAEEAEYDKHQAVPFAWKTKTTVPDPDGFKEAVNGLCTMCLDCGSLTANATLSDCSLMDTYKCRTLNSAKISNYQDDEGAEVIRMEFRGWLRSGRRSSACKVNPIPCDGCKKYSTCSGPYAITNDVQIKKGDVASYSWRSSGRVDNYEVFVGLYSATGGLMDYQFQRGKKQEWRTFELMSPKTDMYHVKFMLASYDGTGGGAVGADMEIKNVIQTKSSKARSTASKEMCIVKFSAFNGMSLRPDPTGQRPGALKKLTKRCLRQRTA